MPSHRMKTLTLNDPILKKWLHARQELLASFHHLCLLRPFNLQSFEEITATLQEFCQLLVDYISLLHFTALERIVAGVESHLGHSTISHHLIERIWQTSLDALDFDEQYKETNNISSLDQDLSSLSERLARRMELEDNLLTHYYQAMTRPSLSSPAEELYAKSA